MSDILFVSLVQDINSLETLILKIYDLQKDSPFAIYSWRLPTKNFLDTINFTVDQAQPTSLQYTTILEVVIDRLYVLLTQYLEYTINATAKCSLEDMSGRPQKISLGALNNNLWDKIESICDLNEYYDERCNVGTRLESENKTIAICEMVCTESQTEDMPSSQCNSCFVAINCIKNMARQMELLLPDSFTEKNRKQIEPNIYELTQFGCMNSIITALLADVTVLTDTIKKTQNDYREETARNSMLRNKLENASKCISNLEIELTKMENTNEKLTGEIENYKSELQSICKSESTYKSLLKSLPQELQIAQDKIKSFDIELQSVQFSETILKSQIDNLQKQQELVIVERDMWKLRFNSSQNTNNTLSLCNDDLANDITALADSVQRTEESYQSMKILMEVNACKVDEKIMDYETLLVKLQGSIQRKLVTQEKKIVELKKIQSQTSVCTNALIIDEHTKKQKEKIIKGNPIEDMAKQIEVNNVNMKKLQEQNDALIHTINKLQAIQVKKRLSIF